MAGVPSATGVLGTAGAAKAAGVSANNSAPAASRAANIVVSFEESGAVPPMLFSRADVAIRINFFALLLVRVMGAPPPWGQSLLRSCLAAHSFQPPPPATCCPPSGHP